MRRALDAVDIALGAESRDDLVAVLRTVAARGVSVEAHLAISDVVVRRGPDHAVVSRSGGTWTSRSTLGDGLPALRAILGG